MSLPASTNASMLAEASCTSVSVLNRIVPSPCLETDVSCDRPKRFAKAGAGGADAIIPDLEDLIAASAKDAARKVVVVHLRAEWRGGAVFVRVNPSDADLSAEDLAALAGLPRDHVSR